MELFISPCSTSSFRRGSGLSSVSSNRTPNQQRLRRSVAPVALARTSWPVGRFLTNFFFYTPLGMALRGRPVTPSVSPTASTNGAGTGDARPVLVTGASGATGRRVIAELLSRGRRVRALTRSREKLLSALRDLPLPNSLDLDALLKKSQLQIIVSDLYNVPADALFDIAGAINCTGTKTGPVDDDEQRSKYYQGVVYYPPEVLEDTPSNVELRGVRRVAGLAQGELDMMKGTTAGDELFDFGDVDAIRRTWGALDDVVMGGVSQSSVRSAANGKALIFEGNVSTDNNGGFASTRTADFDDMVDLSAYDGVQLRVRGDGKRYKLILRCERRWDGYAHCFSFDTPKDEWAVISAPFDKFNTVFRGRTVSDGPRFDASKVVAVQLMLSKFEYDGDLNPSFSAGPFSLTVAQIRPFSYCRKPGEADQAGGSGTTPCFVHLSSAAVTRPQRLDEVRGTDADVPILQLNERIGRLLDWKLAGEDAIRTTKGLPYTVVRSCALTLDDAVGLERLRFDQGDTINGRVARDDIATLLVEAFDCPQLAGKTFEVATVDADHPAANDSLQEKAARLASDDDSPRTFGPFPYIPAAEEEAAAKA